MGMNVLVVVFTLLFNVYNTLLISVLFADEMIIKNLQIGFIYIFNVTLIIVTKFEFSEISWMATLQIVISVIYIIILIPSFLLIMNDILSETINEMKEQLYLKTQFKNMFDSLQEGIIVFQNGRLIFTNNLAGKILNKVSGMYNFTKNYLNSEKEEPNTSNVDMKIFFVYNHHRGKQAQQKMKSNKKMTKKKLTNTVTSSDKESFHASYSIREIAQMPIFMLNQLIFTYERKLNDKDVTQAQTIETNLEKLIKGLRCMKGIDEEFIPTFKFF